jgi:osmoprotectant transport system permease protein
VETFWTYLVENAGTIIERLLEHLMIVALALAVAIPAGVALGLLLSRSKNGSARDAIFALLGVGQTIPSLAILALAVGTIGLGTLPAVLAIVVYIIIPVARNTTAGIALVPPATVDAARGIGMSGWQILKGVEIPLALPLILAGVRTATVVAISTGTLAYLIGAGGLGELIFTGIALFRPEMMIAGAAPAALLALGADWLLGAIERRVAGRTADSSALSR